ncbi:MAG: hypothetical protein LUE99_10500 [Bacteroides sp.]|nr:hypothetical protein [Bacteroides sp.]
MKHSIINKVYPAVACLCLLMLGACGAHELPEDGGVDPTIVHAKIVLLPGADMTPFDAPEFSTRAADARQYEVRYQVEVMPTTSTTRACSSAPNSFILRGMRMK